MLYLLDKQLKLIVLSKIHEELVQVLAFSLIPYMSKQIISILWTYVASGFIK